MLPRIRIAYGLLDKVAGFINAYYKLGMEATRIDFRNIWHVRKGVIRPKFLNKPTLHLRGLYWLYKTSSETIQWIRIR